MRVEGERGGTRESDVNQLLISYMKARCNCQTLQPSGPSRELKRLHNAK